ncbi:dihydrofolate reductase family protein [Nakamurella leprariae]|uniref:Dihydrofolate reductase family protein n=1 Tax=Nakamurella leprariae TaxID=2803911 RepID=A0A938YE67_9ACTN|nr:dihydrofolate reductase family protein [Nakamurella leprariae]MBM9467916.1 dihydrofolate reductase family protein [Nakamurella leprariae]
MADTINSIDKVVGSTTLGDPEWANTTVVRHLDAVRALHESDDGAPILVAGSRTLVHGLLLAWSVDELRLQVFPVGPGLGRPGLAGAAGHARPDPGRRRLAGLRGAAAGLPSPRHQKPVAAARR